MVSKLDFQGSVDDLRECTSPGRAPDYWRINDETPAICQAANLTAWEAYQRGLWHIYQYRQEGTAMPLELLHKAAQLDPEYAYSVRQIIDSYTLVGGMPIEDLAWLTDQSVRTLQRRLESAGLSFNEMISESRYRHACDKLRNSNMSVTEVARLLGYSDPAHFSRAFRRWSGVSPSEFIKAQ